MNALRERAIALRLEGYSYRMIADKLGVSNSSMSYWFREIPYNPNPEVLERIKKSATMVGARRHNQRVAEINNLREKGKEELGTLTKRDFLLLGLGVYIGEGAKTTEGIRISNSDPFVIKLAVQWLKQICGLTNDNFSIRIHAYPDSDIEACELYWKEVTGLTQKNFREANIDRRTNKTASRAGKLPYGTAHLSVLSNGDIEKGVRLFRRINGWIIGAMQQIE